MNKITCEKLDAVIRNVDFSNENKVLEVMKCYPFEEMINISVLDRTFLG